MSKKMLKKFEDVEAEFREWKKKYSRKTIPSNLSEKEQQAFLDEVMLAKKGKKVMISGGGRVLLLCAIMENKRRSWKDVLANLKKREVPEYYLENLKFQFREKLFGLRLLQRADPYRLMEE